MHIHYEGAVTVLDQVAPVRVWSWVPRSDLDRAAGGECDVEAAVIEAAAAIDAGHGDVWHHAPHNCETVEHVEVMLYVASAASGGDMRMIPTVVLGRPTLDLVAVEEAARIAGVSPNAIHKAHSRGTMPAPVPVAGTAVLVWRRSEIEEWARTRPGPGRPSLGRDHHTNAGF